MEIRDEQAGDLAALLQLNRQAFNTDVEARLVEALRAQASPLLSLVAVHHEQMVGHLMCSPMGMPHQPEARLMGLAPLAVAGPHRGQGAGGELVHRALERCRDMGYQAVLALGEPDFYSRLGFVSASRFGLLCPYDLPEELFTAIELYPGSLQGLEGRTEYHPAFATL